MGRPKKIFKIEKLLVLNLWPLGGYGGYCPEGIPVEFALLSLLGIQLYLTI